MFYGLMFPFQLRECCNQMTSDCMRLPEALPLSLVNGSWNYINQTLSTHELTQPCRVVRGRVTTV